MTKCYAGIIVQIVPWKTMVAREDTETCIIFLHRNMNLSNLHYNKIKDFNKWPAVQVLTCNPQLLYLLNFGYWLFTWKLASLPLPPRPNDSHWRNPVSTFTSFHRCLLHQPLIFRSTKHRINGDAMLPPPYLWGQSEYDLWINVT